MRYAHRHDNPVPAGNLKKYFAVSWIFCRFAADLFEYGMDLQNLQRQQDTGGRFGIYKWSLEYQIYRGFDVLSEDDRKKSDKRLLDMHDRFGRFLQENLNMVTLPAVFSGDNNITDILRSIFTRYAYFLCGAGIRCENSAITESLYFMAEYISASAGDISERLKEHQDHRKPAGARFWNFWNVNAPSGVNIRVDDMGPLDRITRHAADRDALGQFVGDRRTVVSIYRLVLLYIAVSVANCVFHHIDKTEHADDIYSLPLTAAHDITYMGFMYMSRIDTDVEDRAIWTDIIHVEFKHILALLSEEIDRQQ